MKKLRNIRGTLVLATLLLALLGLTMTSCSPISESTETSYQLTVQLNYQGGGSQTLFMTASESYSVPTRTGYDFLGLFTEPSGGSMVYNEFGACQILLDQNMTLYAQWAPRTYRIAFDGREASVPDGYKTQEVIYDSELSTFPSLEREGYIFVGWEDSLGNLYSDGATVLPAKKQFNVNNYVAVDETGTLTLYARFEIKKYTVTLDYNDGTYRTETLEVEHGKPLTAEQRPTEDTGSRRLVAWTAMAGGTEDFRGVVTQNMTLYAVWRDYRITTLNDSSGKEYKVEIFKDEPLDLATYNGVTLPGYDLEGWYTSPTYGGNPVTEITYATAEQTYYAKWTVATYTIIFDCSPTSQRLDPMTYQMGDTTELPSLSLEGYTFNGWLPQGTDAGTPMNSLPDTMYGDLTLCASLTPNEYTISLDIGDTVNVKYKESFTLPVPVMEGYNFTGWSIAGKVVTDEKGRSLAGYDLLTDTVATACWEIKRYTVTFESNGGTKVDSITVDHNDYLPIPTEPTKAGVILDGWYDKELTTPYTSSTRVTSAMTLYAKWIVSNPVSSVEELMNIQNAPSENYHLICDIDLKGGAISSLGNLGGILDGKGFCIKNFVFDVGESSNALIGTNNGIIRNLTLKDFVFKASTSTSTETVARSVFVNNNNNRIENCHIVDGVITITDTSEKHRGYCERRAGIVTYKNNGTIEGCTVDADITVYHRGRATSSYGADFQSYNGIFACYSVGMITDCHSSGKITITTSIWGDYGNLWGGSCFGGIVYSNEGKGTVQYCSSDMEIIVKGGNPESNGNYVGIGGLVALNKATIQYCASNVTIDYEGFSGGQSEVTGGLVCNNGGNISNSYSNAIMRIYDRNHTCVIDAGVFAGWNSGTITNSYTAGSIHSEYAHVRLGGFVGSNSGVVNKSLSFSDVITSNGKTVGFFAGANGSTISGCLYSTDTTVTGSATGTLNTDGTPEAFDTLTDPAFLTGELSWDTSIWKFEKGKLPTLK